MTQMTVIWTKMCYRHMLHQSLTFGGANRFHIAQEKILQMNHTRMKSGLRRKSVGNNLFADEDADEDEGAVEVVVVVEVGVVVDLRNQPLLTETNPKAEGAAAVGDVVQGFVVEAHLQALDDRIV